MKLTKTVIDGARYSGSAGERVVLWDDEIPGFGLRIYPSGKRAYVLSYRSNGRKRLMTIGPHGVFTLQQARDRSRQLCSQVIGKSDPLAERKRAALGETVADLCRDFMERHSKMNKKSWKEDERRITRYIVPAFGNHKVKGIHRADVASLHHKIGKNSVYEANHTINLLSKMFSLAETWGFLDEGAPNPARKIEKYPTTKRDRWVTPEELPRLAEAVEQEGNLYARFAVWLYLLTGLRKQEVLSLRWDQIDFTRNELGLPDTKSGRPHYLPLSGPAIRLLEKIPRLDGNPYVIPGHKKGCHLVNITKPWVRIRERAHIEDVRLHDLRRTVGSWLAQAGNSLHLVARVLNHTSLETTKIYARFGQDQVREALERHGNLILKYSEKSEEGEADEKENCVNS